MTNMIRKIAVWTMMLCGFATMEAAERTVKVAGTTLADMASALDVLNQQAGVEVIDSYVFVEGRYQAAIYVGDRQINDVNQLRRIAASQIDSLLVIVNPDSEYDKGIHAVIRITMLKKAGDSLTSESQLKMDMTHALSWNFGQFLSWQKNRFSLEASFNYREADKHRDMTVFSQTYTPKPSGDGLQLKERTTLEFIQNYKRRSYDATAALGWKVADGHKLSLRYELTSEPKSKNTLHCDGRVEKTFIADGQGHVDPDAPSSVSYQDVRYYIPTTRHEWNVAYTGDMRSWKLSGDVKLSYETPFTTVDVKQEGDIVYDVVFLRHALNEESRLTARHALKNGSVAFGLSDTYDWMNVRYDDAKTDDDRIHSHVHEHTAALFANIDQQWGRWSVAGGVRYEYTAFGYKAQDDDETLAYLKESGRGDELNVTHDYHRLHPNASVTYATPYSSVTLAYTQNINTPDFAYSRVGRDYVDNPDGALLHSELQHTTSLTWKYRQWIQAGLGHTYTRHPIFTSSDDFYYFNGDNYHAVDATLMLSPQISLWKPTLTVALHKQWNNMKTANGVNHLSAPLLNVQWNNIVQLPAKWTLYVNTLYRSRGGTRNMRMYSTDFTASANLQKSLLDDRLLLSLSAANIFRSECKDMSLYYRAEQDTSTGPKIYAPRTVSFSAIYRFRK